MITDPAGAMIANADIEVRNAETNAPYPTITTDTGSYTVPRLAPGPHSVTVSAAGFKTLRRTGLTVDAGQTIPLDLTLEVGSATESVTVQVRAEFVNIFNRTQIGNPSTSAPGSAPSKSGFGQYTAGFGVINMAVSGPQTAPSPTLNALVGQLYALPRTGTLIARFTF